MLKTRIKMSNSLRSNNDIFILNAKSGNLRYLSSCKCRKIQSSSAGVGFDSRIIYFFLIFVFESSASLIPSPTKLMLETVSTSSMPGGTQSHGLDESTVIDCAA